MKPNWLIPGIEDLSQLIFLDDGLFLLMASKTEVSGGCGSGSGYTQFDFLIINTATGETQLPLQTKLRHLVLDPKLNRLLTVDAKGMAMSYVLQGASAQKRSIQLPVMEFLNAQFAPNNGGAEFRTLDQRVVVWNTNGLANETSLIPLNDHVKTWCRAISGLEFSTDDGSLQSISDEARIKEFHETELPAPWAELRERLVTGSAAPAG